MDIATQVAITSAVDSSSPAPVPTHQIVCPHCHQSVQLAYPPDTRRRIEFDRYDFAIWVVLTILTFLLLNRLFK